MHNTERDNRALFSLFFFFFYSPPIVEGENVITVFCNAQFPLTIFQLSQDTTTGSKSRVQFYFEKFPRKFFFSYLDSVENLTIRFPTERATAFSLIPREILCSIKDWEGKIRYQPATGEIDGEELQREREREEILVFLSWQFHTYPFSTPQQCTSGRFPSFRAFLCQPSKSFSSPPPPPARNVGSL